jgi:hypothetical protein
MAELSLLPAVRKAPDDAIIAADGTSCRHQIKESAVREALHVARLLAIRFKPYIEPGALSPNFVFDLTPTDQPKYRSLKPMWCATQPA